MTDFQLSFWLVLMGVVELVAIFVAIFYVFLHDKGLHKIQKVGFAFMVFGLIVQLFRSSHYLTHGTYPPDVHFPLWISKDIGAAILIFYYSFIHRK